MTKYQNNFMITDEEIDAERDMGDVQIPDNASTEEKSFAKRYGDLRRHAQQKETTLANRIKELEEKLNSTVTEQMQLPTSEADIEKWVQKYPEVAKIVIGIARQQAKTVTADIDARVKKLDEQELELAKEKAQAKLAEKHPDFFDEIRSSEQFLEWLEEQPESTRSALYDNDTDWRAASQVISDYKYEFGIGPAGKQTKKADTRREAAASIKTSGGAAPSGNKQMQFSESQIARMNQREYEQHEEAIEKAMREGKVLMDISGGAR